MKRKLKKSVTVILSLVIIGIVIVVVTLVIFSIRIVPNPAGTIGNTAGNLNNDGLFCEYDGTVYFLNSFENGGIFAMSPDETNLRRVNYLQVRNILAGGKYLYYYNLGVSYKKTDFGDALGLPAFHRSKLNGNDALALTTDTLVTGQLVDNYLYLLTQKKDHIVSNTWVTAFYKMKIDKSDQVLLAAYAINPACADNGVIYYNGTQGDHWLYALDTATDVPYEVWRGNVWYPSLEGDYVYYLDVANNYRLCRYSRSQNVIEVLTEDRVDCFNVGGGYIYYQKNDSKGQLICMRTDGSDKKVIADGIFTHINMTSQYVYFQQFRDETNIYHSRLGSDSYELFYRAMEAAKQEK